MYGPTTIPITGVGFIVLNFGYASRVSLVAVSLLLVYAGFSIARLKWNERKLRVAGKKIS